MVVLRPACRQPAVLRAARCARGHDFNHNHDMHQTCDRSIPSMCCSPSPRCRYTCLTTAREQATTVPFPIRYQHGTGRATSAPAAPAARRRQWAGRHQQVSKTNEARARPTRTRCELGPSRVYMTLHSLPISLESVVNHSKWYHRTSQMVSSIPRQRVRMPAVSRAVTLSRLVRPSTDSHTGGGGTR